MRDWLTVDDHVDALLLADLVQMQQPASAATSRWWRRSARCWISTELGWQPRHSFEEGLAATVRWTLAQQGWCQRVREQGGYSGGRLGMLAAAGAN